MHIGPHVDHPKRVFDHLVGPANPATGVRMIKIFHHRPADFSRLKVAMGLDDTLGNQPREHGDIIRIRRSSKRPHCAGSRMRVGC